MITQPCDSSRLTEGPHLVIRDDGRLALRVAVRCSFTLKPLALQAAPQSCEDWAFRGTENADPC